MLLKVFVIIFVVSFWKVQCNEDEFEVFNDGSVGGPRKRGGEGGGRRVMKPVKDKDTTDSESSGRRRAKVPPSNKIPNKSDSTTRHSTMPTHNFKFPAGRIIQLHESIRPAAFAFNPSRNAFTITDGRFHGDKYLIPQVQDSLSWWSWLTWKAGLNPGEPYPFAYLISTDGQFMRTLEFVDRSAISLGVAESEDEHVAFSFYNGPGLEVWTDSLELKLTFHELGWKPSLPIFDSEGRLWLPYTVADRQGEAGESVTVLWVYNRDGSKWETFQRRQLADVKYPYTVHIDSVGRVGVAGLKEWSPWASLEDVGEAPGVVSGDTALEFYMVSGESTREEFKREQQARWVVERGASSTPSPGEAESSVQLKASLILEASYTFPFPSCLGALFILTGDGHAITACKGRSEIKVLRVGYLLGDTRTNNNFNSMEDLDASLTAELESARLARESLPGKKSLREAWTPPLPLNASTLRLFSSEAGAQLVASFENPWGLFEVAGLAMNPSGDGFAVLDTATSRLISVHWPWAELYEGEDWGLETLWEASSRGPPEPTSILTSPPPLPPDYIFTVPEPPRSS